MSLPQGDLGLLETDTAQKLLASTSLARLAYTGLDGKPRAVPIWFHWTGDELVMGSFAGAAKARALRANPDLAVTIDTEGFPCDVLLLRGTATVADVDGWVPEYLESARRYLGEEGAAGFTAGFDAAEVKMHRIGLRPEWAGLIDFQTRFPAVLGGVQG
jgi:pyridoxamine 5'-phosphate oxidase-like protein